MKNILLIVMLAGLAACANMTEREKQTTSIVTSILIGAVIISASDGDTTVINGRPCHNNGKHHRECN